MPASMQDLCAPENGLQGGTQPSHPLVPATTPPLITHCAHTAKTATQQCCSGCVDKGQAGLKASHSTSQAFPSLTVKPLNKPQTVTPAQAGQRDRQGTSSLTPVRRTAQHTSLTHAMHARMQPHVARTALCLERAASLRRVTPKSNQSQPKACNAKQGRKPQCTVWQGLSDTITTNNWYKQHTMRRCRQTLMHLAIFVTIRQPSTVHHKRAN